ncbi:MAG: hypothetical protein KBD56_04770 [Candidatus Eisenbacteria bacterium]|nr:hypothetical protein [Candidatus Eisenbacteria bacterium]
MTHFNEREDGQRVGRVLALMGALLQEMAALVNGKDAAHDTDAKRIVDAVQATGAMRAAEDTRGEHARAAQASEEPATKAAAAPRDEAGPAERVRDREVVREAPSHEEAQERVLVCRGTDRTLAFPWRWVSRANVSEGADARAGTLTISDGTNQCELAIERVLGMWTRAEIGEWKEGPVWLESASDLQTMMPASESHAREAKASHAREARAGREALPTPDENISARVPSLEVESPAVRRSSPRPAFDRPAPFSLEPSLSQPTAVRNEPSSPDLHQPPSGFVAGRDQKRREIAEPERVWVASPSALARRFLQRHLTDLGFEVLEARDLDDPLLPADLGGVRALFLDESLLEDWKARAMSSGRLPPLVSLPLDGELAVPPDGCCPPGGAVLPRPFERTQVERVVHWLRTLPGGCAPEDEGDHGEEDDTWLFADPFGATRAGEHSRR